jgi:hypothetical protein
VLTTRTLTIHKQTSQWLKLSICARFGRGSHFSGDKCIDEGKFTILNKTRNHQNVAQAGLIENLWGILAQKINEGGWKATTQQGLISRIQSQLKNFDSIFLQRHMGGVKTKLRAIAERGVLASYKK